MRLQIRTFLTVAVFMLAACSGGGGGTGVFVPTPSPIPSPSSSSAVVPCSAIGELRDLGTALTYVTNPRTGDTLEYTIIGDAAVSKDVLVMFTGTGQIMTGWPVQMLTNSQYSPKIVASSQYDALEDGPVSLCHNYRIALFDLPGVGNTPLSQNLTRDSLANDVDAMLNDASTHYKIDTTLVDPVGWSLGTTDAEKYAVLSPASNAARKIHNVILIAGNAGGSMQGQVGSNSASCVTSMFNASLTATGVLDDQLKLTLSKMIFPYIGQTQAQNGTNSGCTASIVNNTLSLNVTPDCGALNHCTAYLAAQVVDSLTFPWSITKGLDDAVYAQQRQLSHDFDVAYCSNAGPNFTSLGCTAYATVQNTAQNGGVCKTDTSNPDQPVVSACVRMQMTGTLSVINGYEDLLTQWTYGQALVNGYSQAGNKTMLYTYPGSAGHGVMVQHPLWTQTQMNTAMQ